MSSSERAALRFAIAEKRGQITACSVMFALLDDQEQVAVGSVKELLGSYGILVDELLRQLDAAVSRVEELEAAAAARP